MDSESLFRTYFQEGTRGRAVVRRFFARYGDVLARIHLTQPDDVVHEVFIAVAKTDFEKVRNTEHYVMRTVKLQCWSLLDKAIRQKARTAGSVATDNPDDQHIAAREPEQASAIDEMELLAQVNLFKDQASDREVRLLNLLIDETPREEIAALLALNMNTLDTHIRRLRIRLGQYLRSLGYTYKSLERFS